MNNYTSLGRGSQHMIYTTIGKKTPNRIIMRLRDFIYTVMHFCFVCAVISYRNGLGKPNYIAISG